MINDITDFLPFYASVESQDFETSLYKKYEFYENRLGEPESVRKVNFCTLLANSNVEKESIEAGDYLKHQKIASLFMSTHTDYDRLLVVHQMGTGKTKLAIAVCERLRAENSYIRRALICAKGHSLLDNFKRELVCETDGRYVPDNYRYMSSERRVREENRLLRKFYDFYRDSASRRASFGYTFYELSKTIQELSDEEVRDQYSNYVIVVDEIHNIRDKDVRKEAGSVQIYAQLYRLFHLTENTKVVLMSGTPIRDRVEEIAEVLNLILSVEERLPTGREFIEQYFEESEGGYYNMKESMIGPFKEKLKGKVSYLRAVTSDVPKVLIGEKGAFGLQYFTVYPVTMSTFQSQKYLEYYRRDAGLPSLASASDDAQETRGNIWLNSRQASLFVFPDGSVGDAGFLKYVKKREAMNIAGGATSSEKKRYSLGDDLSTLFRGDSPSAVLSKVRRLSAKYAACIENIEASYSVGKLQFVYCEYVKGGGCILLSLILERFGFSRATGRESTPGKRYALLTSETTSLADLRAIQARFNSPDNITGTYISVLIGSDVISEGFSFLNVQTEHILTLFWNYAKIDQAIARGYRYGSHRDLIAAGINPSLDVYQYVALPESGGSSYGSSSINVKMAKVSEVKDVNNKRVERLIKEAAFDCALNYNQNHVTGMDDQRECDYQSCEYTCDGIDPELYTDDRALSESEIDFSTYQLYYADKSVRKIKRVVRDVFRLKFKVSLEYLFGVLEKDTEREFYTKFEIMTTLKSMIDENEVVHNRFNIPCFIREMNNVYYLVGNFILENDVFCDFYTQNIFSKRQTNYSELLSRRQEEVTSMNVELIFKQRDDAVIRDLVTKLPLEVQEKLLEACVVADHLKIPKNELQRSTVLDVLKFYIQPLSSDPNVTVSSLLYRSNSKLRCFDASTASWDDCSPEETSNYAVESTREVDKTLYEGYYGLYNPQTDSFCLTQYDDVVQTKASKKKTGVSCGTGSMNKKELVRLAVKVFKVPLPSAQSVQKNKVWNGENRDKLLKLVLENTYTKNLFTEEEYSSAPLSELQRVLFWANFTVKSETKGPSVCGYLKDWLEKEGLLFTDYDCGTQFKKKK